MRAIFWMIRDSLSQLSPFKVFRRWGKKAAAWRRFWRRFYAYRRAAAQDKSPLPTLRRLTPCIHDDASETWIEPVYFFQDNWAFGKIVAARPVRHVDVGSHHKFVALLSMVVPVTMVDIRPLSLPVPTLQFQKGSIVELPFPDRSIPSVSSICVIEHIGLGRYGDPIDPHGTEKAAAELKRIVAPGGDLYISVPIEKQNRIYFDANRAFTEEYVLQLFAPFEVVERRYIYGNTFGDALQPRGGTGCYHFRRPASV
jgi:SAM-dependent methyltransferase